ncbi:ATP-binding cassette domain-containing protein [Haloferula sp.]|uniref:ATP-binding cassette domain-containing protein n=1 Tax=Haloferula sp. TaxID=2497595 RepID=UPI003C722105
MSDGTPHLKLSSGLTIGYQTPLAKTVDSINLESGTHFLLARNGRGKTTLLRTISRSLKQIDGSVEAEGRMQYVPEDLRFDEEIPVFAIFKAMIPAARLAAASELAERIELDLKKPYGKLSTGNRRKTSLIVAEYSLDPSVSNILLLDEPFSGLDAHARAAFEDIWKMSADKTLRLVSCHPDYDSMAMPSALLIQDGTIQHTNDASQTWTQLKNQLN